MSDAPKFDFSTVSAEAAAAHAATDSALLWRLDDLHVYIEWGPVNKVGHKWAYFDDREDKWLAGFCTQSAPLTHAESNKNFDSLPEALDWLISGFRS